MMLIEKNCNYCLNDFRTENQLKRFCNIACKNKANYENDCHRYKYEIAQSKKRKKNILILRDLIKRDKTELSKHDLITLGFELSAAFLPEQLSDDEVAYRYGNFYLVVTDSNECKIFRLNEYQDYVS